MWFLIVVLYNIQGDADYLRYHGLQEFDVAMQHLEGTYGVCNATVNPCFIFCRPELFVYVFRAYFKK